MSHLNIPDDNICYMLSYASIPALFVFFGALGFRINSLKVGGEDVGLQLKDQPWVYTVHHYSSASVCVRPAFQVRLLVSFLLDANLVCCY